jgi:hypothetical protein
LDDEKLQVDTKYSPDDAGEAERALGVGVYDDTDEREEFVKEGLFGVDRSILGERETSR